MMSATANAFSMSADLYHSGTHAMGALGDLSCDLNRALDQAIWAFDFRGELEEALDEAILRSVLADTPTLSGGLLSMVAA